MASVISLQAQIASITPKVYEKSRLTAAEKAVYRAMVDSVSLVGKPGETVDIPRWGAVTVIEVLETDTLESQSLGTANVVLGVKEYGGQTTISDRAMEASNEDITKRHGEILGKAIAKADDVAAIACFDNAVSFTLTAGVKTTDIALADFTKAQTLLRGNFADGEIMFNVHPFAWHLFASSLLADGKYGALSSITDELGKRFRQSALMGVRITDTMNIPQYVAAGTLKVAGAAPVAGDYCTNHMFVSDAVVRVDKRALRLEPMRYPSKRFTEFNATSVFGYTAVETMHAVRVLGKTFIA